MSPERKQAAFTGTRSVEAGLTWSQQEIWSLIEDAAPEDHVYNVVGVIDVPDGTRVDELRCLRAVSFFVSRHEALRTLFPRDRHGRVSQRVLREGVVPVAVARTDEPDTAGLGVAGLTAALREDFGSRPFSYADELPVRIGLVVSGGDVRAAVYAFSHMAVDWFGLDALLQEVRAYFRDGETLPPLADDATRPADLANWQASPEGVAKGTRALRHIEATFGGRPLLFLPPALGTDAAGPGHHRAALRSPAANLATGVIARHMGMSTTSVVLGCAAALLGETTGSGTVDLLLTSSQRFDRDLRHMVATLMQEAYFSVDVTGADVFEIIKRSWRASISAYRNAGCATDALAALLGRLGDGPDAPLKLLHCFNDKRGRTEPVPLAPGTDPQDLLDDSTLTRLPVTEREPFYLVVDGDQEAMEFSLTCDAAHFTPADTEGFLRALESSLVTAAAHVRAAGG
ncbi:condensation domain-containing protein [Streptomyces hesseae]|uniref:Condensation domain-containing protein n=1 Tax=Streptomyces hesseae TaxID=3075519 RepID=A0ABU2SFA2_9ACTN|nr:condensation domain-containing protein [Streptomyces sp. DSM 40473]MDT0447625.1 condensation domain-containing protein [Streptomyces sp. DSM 40473]